MSNRTLRSSQRQRRATRRAASRSFPAGRVLANGRGALRKTAGASAAWNGRGVSVAFVRGKRFVLVASRFNPSITEALAQGAVGVLRCAGVAPSRIRTVWVPGAFELPVAAARAARLQPRPHAIIALGAVIRGHTPQNEAIAHAVAQGLALVSVGAVMPVTFGVIVADSMAQARARAGLSAPRRSAGQAVNRGAEAAAAALEMVRMFGRVGTRRR